jgi:hypothetical protein
MRWVVLGVLGCLALGAQEKPARVLGHVRRADTGEPLAKAIVTLHPQDEATAQAGERMVSSGADGAFVLADMAPGVYAIEAERNGFVFSYDGPGRFTVRAGEDASVEIKMAPAAVISGVVLDQDEEPVEGLPVMALRLKYLRGGRREVSWAQRVITDDQGRFRFYGMSEGVFYLRTGGKLERPRTSVPLKRGPERTLEYGDTLYPENAVSEDSEPLRVSAGADIHGIRILVKPEPAFSITGRVEGDLKDSESLQLECNKWIPIVFLFGRGQEIHTDGSFKIEDLQAGEYVLKVEAVAGGRIHYLGYAKVTIIDRNVRVNIHVGQAAEASGTVTEDGTDAVPQGLQVMLYQSGSMGIQLSELDKSGRFDIREVPPGEYHFGLLGPRHDEDLFYLKQVRCSGTDYTTLPVTLDVGVPVGDCRIQIGREMGAVRGDVMDGEKPRPGMSVVLIPESRELRRIRRYTLRVKTDAGGKFEITNAVPGRYFLFALPANEDGREFALSFADRNQGDARSVEIKPGETQVVSLKSLGAR